MVTPTPTRLAPEHIQKLTEAAQELEELTHRVQRQVVDLNQLHRSRIRHAMQQSKTPR